MAGSLVTAWGRATSVVDPDVLDVFVASGVSDTPDLKAPDNQWIRRRDEGVGG